MHKAEWTIESTVEIAPGLRVRLTVGPGGFTAEWEPQQPRTLTPAELDLYRKARDKLLAQLAERMGGGIAIIEI